ncbi:efflux RND transporter periplasmic adaptor subunit [Uliginosibacterium sp. H3]|uniref:Efflux RND transporter periplasmic adaptor subunit n=1 Tax=Uliginosibacterium silvisoli TaxID=3114758 RepID=A0ABU6K0A7_9RHOO|nr:efflux RND transporter periplasmic adaptor subunit [Uliginosibacterium sp. H3]
MKINTHDINKRQWAMIFALLAIAAIGAALILGVAPSKSGGDGHGHADEHGHAEGEHVEAEAKGPHGGELFKDGDFGLEVKLAEEGGEARLRVWLFDKDTALPASAATLAVTLTRANGDKENISFAADKDSLRSVQRIAEPHAFEAAIEAQTPKEPYLFSFTKDEGEVAMSEAQIKAANITVDSAAAASIRNTLQLPGEIRFNQDRTAHVVPRVQGVVESVHADLGQQLKKGQLLAVITSTSVSELRSEQLATQKRLALAKTTFEREKKLWEEKITPQQDYLQAEQVLREAEIANANAQQKLAALGVGGLSGNQLSRFELRAPFDGMVVEKHVTLGESVKEDAQLFTLSDLSNVWAEMSVPAKDMNLVRVGDKVTIRATAFESQASGKVSYVGALIGEQTRTATARVTLPNPQGAWRPGLFVNVELTSSETPVAVSIASDAIQTIGDKPTVFVRTNAGFVAQPVELGRSDGQRVEVLKGLKAGTRYAAAGSFVVKAELGKSSAAHEH